MIARVVAPVLGLGALALATTGCDDDPSITPGALAYVAADHAGTPDTAGTEPFDWFDAFDDDAVAVELRYHPTTNDPGDGLTVTLGRLDVPELTDCDATVGLYTQACEETDGGTLRWNLDDPEEDPGGVFVLVPKSDGQTVMVTFNGPRLHRDPRTVDLPVSVETLFDIAHDPRIDVTTTQDVVDRGAELPYLEDR